MKVLEPDHDRLEVPREEEDWAAHHDLLESNYSAHGCQVHQVSCCSSSEYSLACNLDIVNLLPPSESKVV